MQKQHIRGVVFKKHSIKIVPKKNTSEVLLGGGRDGWKYPSALPAQSVLLSLYPV